MFNSDPEHLAAIREREAEISRLFPDGSVHVIDQRSGRVQVTNCAAAAKAIEDATHRLASDAELAALPELQKIERATRRRRANRRVK